MNVSVTNTAQNLWTSLLSSDQRALISAITQANGNVKIIIYNASTTSTDVVYVESGTTATTNNGYPIEQKKELQIFSTNLANYSLIGNVASIDVRIFVCEA